MSAAAAFPLADIPRRLDELPVHYVRHHGPWKDRNVDVTLHAPRVPFPRTAQVRADAHPPPADSVVWRVTLLCPGTYSCTPRAAARAAKSKTARCCGRLRIEVVRSASGAFAARFVEHGEHGANFAVSAASERTWWQRKLLVARPLDDAASALERAGVAHVGVARALLQQQQAYQRRKRARLTSGGADATPRSAQVASDGAAAFDWAAYDVQVRAQFDALERVGEPSGAQEASTPSFTSGEDAAPSEARAAADSGEERDEDTAQTERVDVDNTSVARSLGGTRSSDDAAANFAFDHPTVLALVDVVEDKVGKELAGFGDEMLLAMIDETFAPFLGALDESDEPPESADAGKRGNWRPLAKKHASLLPRSVERINELRVGNSTAAGNCLFSSVAMLLYDRRRDDGVAKWLRARCVLELAAHARAYREWLGGEALRDVLASLLGGNGTRDPELDALWLLANVVRRRIVVFAKPHAQDACAARAFVPFRTCPLDAAPPAVLVLVHVHYRGRGSMANHYQPLARESGEAVLRDDFVRERCQLHRPTNRALFDQLAPFCGLWCAMATIIVEDGNEPVPLRRENDALLDAPELLDDALLAALSAHHATAVRSLLPTHTPTASCLAALCSQVCAPDGSALRSAIVEGVAPRRSADELWAAGDAFAVLCRGAEVGGERQWLAARVQRPRVEWWSSHYAAAVPAAAPQVGEKRGRRGQSRTQSAAAEKEALERMSLVDALGWHVTPTAVDWSCARSSPVDICRAEDAPLWAVSMVWLWAFGDVDRVRRARVDGATRLGCAVALASADDYRLGAARGPPLRGAPRSIDALRWLDRWHALAAQRTEQRALVDEQLNEETA